MEFIADPATLEGVYGPAGDWARRGEGPAGPAIDDDDARFIEQATLAVIATVGHGGVSCSPRGAAAGQLAAVIDPRTVWVPDVAGGRLHQSVRNLMEDPRIGLLLLAPPHAHALRLEGTARVTADPAALVRFAAADPPARSVMVVDVQAVRRSGGGPLRRAGWWPLADSGRH